MYTYVCCHQCEQWEEEAGSREDYLEGLLDNTAIGISLFETRLTSPLG